MDDIKTHVACIFFDLGNTLIYFSGNWKEVIEGAARELVKVLLINKYELDPSRFAAEFIDRLQRYYLERDINYKEISTVKLLQDLLFDSGYPKVPMQDINIAVETFYRITEQYWEPEKETIPLLKALKENNITLAIISNASNIPNVNRLIKKANIKDYFEKVFISAAYGIRKPHPQIFQIALDAFELTPQKCLMVGDTISADIYGSNQIGMRNIWVTRRVTNYKNQNLDIKQKPTYCVESLSEIIGIIDQINY